MPLWPTYSKANMNMANTTLSMGWGRVRCLFFLKCDGPLHNYELCRWQDHVTMSRGWTCLPGLCRHLLTEHFRLSQWLNGGSSTLWPEVLQRLGLSQTNKQLLPWIPCEFWFIHYLCVVYIWDTEMWFVAGCIWHYKFYHLKYHVSIYIDIDYLLRWSCK